MNNPARVLTLEEVENMPDSAFIYIEYKIPAQYHASREAILYVVRSMICPKYRKAHYEKYFRCWSKKPSPAQSKEIDWRNDQE